MTDDLISRAAAIALFDAPNIIEDLRALPSVEPTGAVRVEIKPLEWDHDHLKGWAFARGGVLHYSIMLSVNRVYGVHGEHDGAAQFPTVEAAKSAAQADYEARIRSELVVTPTYDPAKVQALVDALIPLSDIADAYDANELDDEARKWWGKNLEHKNTTPLDEIEIFAGRGGRRLLTLADVMNARAAIAPFKVGEVG